MYFFLLSGHFYFKLILGTLFACIWVAEHCSALVGPSNQLCKSFFTLLYRVYRSSYNTLQVLPLHPTGPPSTPYSPPTVGTCGGPGNLGAVDHGVTLECRPSQPPIFATFAIQMSVPWLFVGRGPPRPPDTPAAPQRKTLQAELEPSLTSFLELSSAQTQKLLT